MILGFEYIDDMMKFMKEKNNIKYSGNIYFYYDGKKSKLRKIYVWKKIN